MLIEILVLRGDESIDDEFRNCLDRQIEPALLGIFRQQRAIRGMHSRHDRRLIILKLRILGQVLGVMPQQASHGGHADDEKDGPHCKQEPEKAQKQFHRGTSVIGQALVEPNSLYEFIVSVPRKRTAAGSIARRHQANNPSVQLSQCDKYRPPPDSSLCLVHVVIPRACVFCSN